AGCSGRAGGDVSPRGCGPGRPLASPRPSFYTNRKSKVRRRTSARLPPRQFLSPPGWAAGAGHSRPAIAWTYPRTPPKIETEMVSGYLRAESRLRRGGWRYLQIAPVAIALWALDAVDKFRAGVQADGLRHAATIDVISDHAGGGVAMSMNHWVSGHPLASAAAAGYYIVLHVLITGVTGFALIRSRHPDFGFHRNALIATSAIGLVVFWLYPVAPPRMLPGYHDIAAASVPLFSSLLE